MDEVIYENNVVIEHHYDNIINTFNSSVLLGIDQKLNIQAGAQMEQSIWMSESKIIVTPKTV